MEQNKNQNGRLIAIITMFFIFAMISFVTNMAAPFGNIWGYKYSWAGMMGNMMNFAAYLFMGIPAGKMLTTVGYKKTALIALIVGTIGLAVQYLSSIFGADIAVFSYDGQAIALNLIIYLLGAFICGFCVCMLNTVVNPMLNLLGGGGNKGNQLIQAGGALNSLSGTLTPFLVGMLIGTVSEKTSMTDVAPLLFIGMGIFIVAFIVISRVNIPEPALERARALQEKGLAKTNKYEHSAWSFRHFVLGAVAIFFYVGIEIGIPGEMNFYISNLKDAAGNPVEGAAAVGGTLVALYWALMLVGRTLSTVVSKWVSTRMQMICVSSVAIIFLLIAIFMPESITMSITDVNVPVLCVFIAICGICTSIMWGGIFNLCVEGLGKYTEQASGIFMMLVVGGGIMPLIQDMALRPVVGYIGSYWLIVAMLAYLLYYSIWGSKNVNKDIPVDIENPEGDDLRDVV